MIDRKDLLRSAGSDYLSENYCGAKSAFAVSY